MPIDPEQTEELLRLLIQIVGPANTAVKTIRDNDWGPLSQYYAAFKFKNLLALNKKIQDCAKKLGFDLEDAKRVAPKVGFLWIDKASLEEDDDLQTMWANLMANAMNPNVADGMGDFELETTHIEILSQFSKPDCQVLEYIVKHGTEFVIPSDKSDSEQIREIRLKRVEFVEAIIEEFRTTMGITVAQLSVEKLVCLGCASREVRVPIVPVSDGFNHVQLAYDIVPTLIGIDLYLCSSGKEVAWKKEESQ